LVAKLVTFVTSAIKHGGQLRNEFFIYPEDITASPGFLKGWKIFKMTAIALVPKVCLITRFQGIVNGVDHQQVTIERN